MKQLDPFNIQLWYWVKVVDFQKSLKKQKKKKSKGCHEMLRKIFPVENRGRENIENND